MAAAKAWWEGTKEAIKAMAEARGLDESSAEIQNMHQDALEKFEVMLKQEL